MVMEIIQECLICANKRVISDERLNRSTVKNHTTIYFVVKKLFEVSEITCVDLLTTRGNPSGWFYCCWRCSSLVEKAEEVFKETKKLEVQWKQLKDTVERKIYECHKDKIRNSSNKNKKSNDGPGSEEELLLNKIRDEIVNRLNREHGFGPTEGVGSHYVEVKSEVDEDKFYLNQNCEDDSSALPKNEEWGFVPSFSPVEDSQKKHSVLQTDQIAVVDQNFIATYEDDGISLDRRLRDRSVHNFRDDDLDFEEAESDTTDDSQPRRVKCDDSDWIPPSGNYYRDSDSMTSSRGRNARRNSEGEGYFSCNFCDCVYKSDEMRKDHERRKHSQTHSFPCYLCDKAFSNLSNVHRHRWNAHGEDRPPVVHRAKKTSLHGDNNFNTDSNSKQAEEENEKILNPGQGNFVCSVCAMVYKSKEKRDGHEMKRHDIPHSFDCNLCAKSFVSVSNLQRHKWNSHGEDRPPYISRKRKKMFSLSPSAVTVKEENVEKPFFNEEDYYTSSFCEEGSDKNGADGTVENPSNCKSESESNLHPCRFCTKVCKSKEVLRDHESRGHNLQHKFDCDLCDKSFSSLSNLRRHKWNFHGEQRPPYIQRPRTTSAFPAVSKLNNNTANNSSSNDCSSQSGGQLEDSGASLRTTDNNDDSLPDRSCTICSTVCKSKESRYDHEMRRHNIQHSFDCNLCEKIFVSLSNLRRHKWNAHGEDRPLFVSRKRKNPETVSTSNGDIVPKDLDSNPSREPSEDLNVDAKTTNDSNVNNDVGNSDDEFRCNICLSVYETKEVRDDHEVRIHKQQHKFKCLGCDKEFFSLRNLRRHKWNAHGEKRPPHVRRNGKTPPSFPTISRISCRYCWRLFETIEKRNDHENRSHNDKLRKPHIFHCNECNETFDFKSSLNRHQEMIHEMKTLEKSTTYKCDKCEIMLPSLQSLQNHAGSVHEQNPKYVCETCHKGFDSEGKLEQHILQTHEKGITDSKTIVHQCKECGKIFGQMYRLESHVALVHRRERNFMCEICSKSFTACKYLKYHQISVHCTQLDLGENLLQCDQCGKILNEPSALKSHIKSVHQKQYKFKCPICKAGRQCKSALDRHVKESHTNERPEVCTVCQKAFSDKSKLNLHMRRHTGLLPYKCETCSKSFNTKLALWRHEPIHSDVKNIQCELCGKKFLTKHYLITHRWYVHNNRRSTVTPRTIASKEVIDQYFNNSGNNSGKKQEGAQQQLEPPSSCHDANSYSQTPGEQSSLANLPAAAGGSETLFYFENPFFVSVNDPNDGN